MKTKSNSIIKSIAALSIAAVVFFNFTTAYAAGNENIETKNKSYERVVKNFEQGIQSENLGLKMSSIYYIGFYQISEAAGTLVKQLKKEKDPEVRALIALSLFKIGDEKGYKTIKNLAEKDEDPNVKRICSEICNEFNKVVNSQIIKINNTNH